MKCHEMRFRNPEKNGIMPLRRNRAHHQPGQTSWTSYLPLSIKGSEKRSKSTGPPEKVKPSGREKQDERTKGLEVL